MSKGHKDLIYTKEIAQQHNFRSIRKHLHRSCDKSHAALVVAFSNETGEWFHELGISNWVCYPAWLA